MMHRTRRKDSLVRAVASQQIATLYKVQVRLINDRAFMRAWQHPLTAEAHNWLYQHAGKGTLKRPAFDAHAKMRWYLWFPQPELDNTRDSTWQQRNDWRRNNTCGEFWFKDQAPAVLFKLTFGG